ncbi:MAG TPA: hypothetical protein VIF09_11160, partial [Polyangiaceae bacterium]
PLFIQGYGVKSPGGGETEFFMEQLEFLLPTGPAPALTDPTFAAKFAANNHPTLKWADEQTAGWNTQDKTETRFKPPGDSPLTNDMGERSMFVNDAIPNPVRKTDDQLTEQCWADNNTPTNDEVFVADTTDGARSAWTTAMTTSALPADTNEIVAIHTSDTGVVDINELQASSNSTLDVGGKGTWAITDAGVGDKDLTLAFGPPATCTANVTGVKINGAAAPVGTATNLNLASGAATITFGTKSKIDCHFSKQTRVSVNATGFRVDRRRDLKDDTSNADFGQRTLVIPDITNAAHYGKVP